MAERRFDPRELDSSENATATSPTKDSEEGEAGEVVVEDPDGPQTAEEPLTIVLRARTRTVEWTEATHLVRIHGRDFATPSKIIEVQLPPRRTRRTGKAL
jgi:hypothetical protein